MNIAATPTRKRLIILDYKCEIFWLKYGKVPKRNQILRKKQLICARCVERDCARLRPGHLSVCAGDRSRRSEEIVKISYCAFQFDIIIIISITCMWDLIRCAKYRLVGLVVRRPPRERTVPGSDPSCAGIFSGSSHTCDLNIDTPVATLPGAWRSRVSVGTGRPGVSILWLGETEKLICNFYLSVAARKIVWADPSLRYTRMLLGR